MKNSGHWMPIYWGDYFGDTMSLSAEEHGIYLLLIGTYWRRTIPLPDDDDFLALTARVSRNKWKRVRQKISDYFVISCGSWWHVRVEYELLRSNDRSNAGRTAGVASAQRRAKNPHPHPQEEENKKKEVEQILSSFGIGKKAGIKNGFTIQDPSERLARFQRTIAEALGVDGYAIVGAASDPSSPEFERCLTLCQAKARDLNRGWPFQWPKKEAR